MVDGVEIELAPARDALDRAALSAGLRRDLERRTADLEQVRKDFDAFSYSVAHDFRAPLRAVEGFATILQEDFSSQMPEEAQAVLGDVTSAARKMDQLAQDLVRFSRVSRQPLVITSVDVQSLFLEALERLRAVGSGREIAIRVGELPPARGDQSLLALAVTNLLSNALKFTSRSEHPRVEIGSCQENGANVYFVRDNGAGFELQYAGRLFGMFQRFHSEKLFEGTGAGLAIARCIIQRHGGRIWADAAVGQGATFRFTLDQRKP
jgi:two-component system, sensor histidine kinase and response regulator